MTNVGETSSVYYANIVPVPGVAVQVRPSVLSFTETNEKITYEIEFSRSATHTNATYVEGTLTWTSNDNRHNVRSPISVKL